MSKITFSIGGCHVFGFLYFSNVCVPMNQYVVTCFNIKRLPMYTKGSVYILNILLVSDAQIQSLYHLLHPLTSPRVAFHAGIVTWLLYEGERRLYPPRCRCRWSVNNTDSDVNITHT